MSSGPSVPSFWDFSGVDSAQNQTTAPADPGVTAPVAPLQMPHFWVFSDDDDGAAPTPSASQPQFCVFPDDAGDGAAAATSSTDDRAGNGAVSFPNYEWCDDDDFGEDDGDEEPDGGTSPPRKVQKTKMKFANTWAARCTAKSIDEAIKKGCSCGCVAKMSIDGGTHICSERDANRKRDAGQIRELTRTAMVTFNQVLPLWALLCTVPGRSVPHHSPWPCFDHPSSYRPRPLLIPRPGARPASALNKASSGASSIAKPRQPGLGADMNLQQA